MGAINFVQDIFDCFCLSFLILAVAIQKKIRCMCYFADIFCDSCRDANYNFMQTTCRRVPKDKFILQKKITKDKWRITETYITKYILNYRVFHRLNHSLAPNRTGDVTFF